MVFQLMDQVDAPWRSCLRGTWDLSIVSWTHRCPAPGDRLQEAIVPATTPGSVCRCLIK